MTTTVRSGVRKLDGQKVLLKTCTSDTDGTGTAEAELRLLRRLSHPNIVKALESVRVEDCSVLVLEFFDGMQLDCAVRTTSVGWLSEPVARVLCAGLMAGVQHLHEKGALHGDLCPQRILVSYDFQRATILGLGPTARRPPYRGHHGAAEAATESHCPRYAAPEVILGAAVSAGSDVWQIGLCLHLMLSGRLPQKRDDWLGKPDTTEATQHVPIEHLQGGSISGPGKSMVRKCLRVDARQRAALPELLQHPWLRAQQGPQAPGGLDDMNPLLMGLEQVSEQVKLPRPYTRRRKMRIADDGWAYVSEGAFTSEATSEPASASSAGGVGQGAKLPGEPAMKVHMLRPFAATATIVTANHAEGTYKVRLPDGSTRTVKAEDTKVDAEDAKAYAAGRPGGTDSTASSSSDVH